MLNEAIDNSKNINYEVVRIRLSNKYEIFLILYFEQTTRKRYLISEEILLDEYQILDQIELINLKIFFKKFISHNLQTEHENIYLEQVQKKVGEKRVIKTLKIKDKKIYLNDLDIETILERWKESSVGFSKVKLNSNEKIIVGNRFNIKFNNSQYIENTKIHTTSLINPNQEFDNTINNSILNGKYTKEEIDLELEKIKKK